MGSIWLALGFLDALVGTGFSYSRTAQGFKTGDMKHAISCYNFPRKSHPKYDSNPLYVAGDSYSGMIVPIITQAISDDIEPNHLLLGNPFTDAKFDGNSKIICYNRMALISDELYESAKSNCKQEYIDVEISNRMCANDLQTISENYYCYLCKVWATDINVQKALHIRKGSIKEWVKCNKSLDYDDDVASVVSYHLCLNTRGYRALIYSGDHDLAVTYVGTESWIKSLNLSIVDDWRPWIVDGQVAGYSREYGNNFTFATVKGAGHTAPEYKPKESFSMFKRWISQQPL
ncbi:hypothetical protein ES288_D12G096100v1 [Gossypium darwinii]|uniref:Uncharacterized protein n=1 Tax=Gossypium darwinii TaxID=34276 RepID=A0A5D2A6G7_GOSDA|nr:hypothetical protein ES288_D12G096100v1 [Gossypium darwinii]